jgi:hypothetical protein
MLLRRRGRLPAHAAASAHALGFRRFREDCAGRNNASQRQDSGLPEEEVQETPGLGFARIEHIESF